MIFPISYHDKNCSDIQQAETKVSVSIEKFSILREVSFFMQTETGGNRRQGREITKDMKIRMSPVDNY